ncbi:MAG: MATE family efflux transporter [Bacteroidaceae bacterium]|nr:MATE family efflux transporter [Bacteroidaceae bacterium]
MKAVITTCLSLYTVRVVLKALTDSDYGLYMLIAGVVTMLGFITNSLIVTTQRYISLLHGKGNIEHVRRLFVNSMVLHWVIGLLLAALLASLEPWLMTRFLNIPAGREETAATVYFIMIFVLFMTILSAPLKALFIARENIAYIAGVEVLDALLKLALAYSLLTMGGDRLLVYVWALLGIQVLNFFVFYVYALWRFPECTLVFRRRDLRRDEIVQLLSFAGWTTYGMGAVTVRTQGIAVVLNHFLGTVVNAAYGIAMQVYMGLSIVTTSIFNAMNPQIMKAEGEGRREKMYYMAGLESKFSVAMMSIVAMPIIFEMPTILSLWLDTVPAHTVMFCRLILISFLCDLLTLGLNTAIQAIGELKVYTLLIYTPKLLTLPLAWVILKYTGSVSAMMWAYVVIELLMALARLPYMCRRHALDVVVYGRTVLMPVTWLVASLLLTDLACMHFYANLGRLILTFAASGIVGAVVFWGVSMRSEERQFVYSLLQKFRKR